MRRILLMFLVFCGVLLTAAAQQKTVSGTVTSSVPGEGAMPGVAVSVPGTTTGATTDINVPGSRLLRCKPEPSR